MLWSFSSSVPQVDVIFFSPPWGGPEYLGADEYDVFKMLPLDMYPLHYWCLLTVLLPSPFPLGGSWPQWWWWWWRDILPICFGVCCTYAQCPWYSYVPRMGRGVLRLQLTLPVPWHVFSMYIVILLYYSLISVRWLELLVDVIVSPLWSCSIFPL